jgi:hypothetical protein
MPIFGQVWLWSLLAFLLGAVLCWLLVARPARNRVGELEAQLTTRARRQAVPDGPEPERRRDSLVPGIGDRDEDADYRTRAYGLRDTPPPLPPERGRLAPYSGAESGQGDFPPPLRDPEPSGGHGEQPSAAATQYLDVSDGSLSAPPEVPPISDPESDRGWFDDELEGDEANQGPEEQAAVPRNRHHLVEPGQFDARLVDDGANEPGSGYTRDDESPAIEDEDTGTVFTQRTRPIPGELIRQIDEAGKAELARSGADNLSDNLVDDLAEDPADPETDRRERTVESEAVAPTAAFTEPEQSYTEPSGDRFTEPEPSLGRFAEPEPSVGRFTEPEPSAGRFTEPEPSVGRFTEPEPSIGRFAEPEPSAGRFTEPDPSIGRFAEAEPSIGRFAEAEPSAGRRFAEPEPSNGRYAEPESPAAAFTEPQPEVFTEPQPAATSFTAPSEQKNEEQPQERTELIAAVEAPEEKPAERPAEEEAPRPANALPKRVPQKNRISQGVSVRVEPTPTAALPKRVPGKPKHQVPVGVQPSSTPDPAPVATADEPAQPARSLFEPIVPAEDEGITTPPPPHRLRQGSGGGRGPFGPGSAMPLPGGASPSPDFTIKASVAALRYCTPESPQFGRTVAEVWFRTAADAERVGFRPVG